MKSFYLALRLTIICLYISIVIELIKKLLILNTIDIYTIASIIILSIISIINAIYIAKDLLSYKIDTNLMEELELLEKEQLLFENIVKWNNEMKLLFKSMNIAKGIVFTLNVKSNTITIPKTLDSILIYEGSNIMVESANNAQSVLKLKDIYKIQEYKHSTTTLIKKGQELYKEFLSKFKFEDRIISLVYENGEFVYDINSNDFKAISKDYLKNNGFSKDKFQI